MRVGIALGSNVGDRAGLLARASRLVFALHEGPGPFLCSKVYETDPVDCPAGSERFLNAAVEMSTELPPLDLLARLQAIEAELGRPSDHGFHSPRTVDLDLLYCENMVLSLPSLTLPHPQISRRGFVLHPLRDICPDRILPHQSRSVRELSGGFARPDVTDDVLWHG
jgi:2-amino-4-hydroxy-6-hydroxymethyldihydropteridine diphosphokinase